MIASVCTSGRGAELILGVAGAGKTTGLDVVRQAFETAGYRVIGTSTSGQAARTLGREAGIETSATMASLLWRIDQGRLRLDPHTVVISDETGMADDPSVLRLLSAAEAAGSKVILVGDHRQLGAVGPGGTLEALVSRYSHAVHVLDENVRQADPQERAALAELRAGNVEAAIDWYSGNDRIRVGADRDRALDQMVKGWAADVAAGKDAAMFAWRRANVTELNRRARAAMADAGKLIGSELASTGRPSRPGTGSSPSPRAAKDKWSPPNGAGSRPSTPRPAASSPAWTTAATTPSPPRSWARSGSLMDTPPPFTAPKGRPVTPPISSPTAAAVSSAMWA